MLLTGLHERVDLVDLLVPDDGADRRRADHDLGSHDPPLALGLRQQRLGDDALEHERELRAYLALLVRGNASMMRLIDSAAEFVCSVAKTR